MININRPRLKQLTFALLIGSLTMGAMAQDNPFAAPATNDPFASQPAPTAAPVNPFGNEASPAAAPSSAPMDDPFADPDAAPVATDQNATEAANPFGAPAAPTEGANNPFASSGGTNISTPDNPFGESEGTQLPAVNTGNRLTMTGRLSPRLEVQLGDARLRRAAEIRGLYVNATQRGLQSTSQVSQLLSDARVGDFNRLYIEARTPQGIAYTSEIESTLPYVSLAYPNPIRDLMNQAGEDLPVIAVTEMLRAHNAAVSSRPPAGNVVGTYPEHIMTDPYGKEVADDNFIYVDPGSERARQYLSAITFELANSVSPYGFLFTGIAYPGEEWGYSEAAVTAFREEVGGSGPPLPSDPTWKAWRRRQLTELIVSLREAVLAVSPTAKISVEVVLDGPPPANYSEYIASDLYDKNMVDWIGWCQSEIIDEIVFVVHERLEPQGNILRQWIPFINSNVGNVRPAISLAGSLNVRRGLASQFSYARDRAIGTVLSHYSDPARDSSRGFFPSLPDTLLRGAPGRPLGGREIVYRPEQRTFTPGGNPPETLVIATATPVQRVNPLEGRDLVFATPSPIPSSTPVPTVVPSQVIRKVTMRNGKVIEVTILEATPNYLMIKSKTSPAVRLSRSVVQSIDPPL